jgi:lipopolysaccharide transport system ATP-binding protein
VIRGRVSSLLEVGTGFHPELTGRENVYMNGTILGMRKKEIDRKFDEIVDFSGVEKFLDTPTKRYSSGMQVRLAFAVAAHLEPEILIVDEVLAVGDAEFQKKCLGKMKDVSSTGQTVLFVSHNLGAVESLCSTCIWISDGKFQTKGDPNATIIEYLRAGSTPKPTNQRLLHDLFDSIEFKSDLPDGTVRMGGRVAFRLGIKSSQRPWELKIGISIEDRNGNRLLALSTEQQCPELLTSIKKISRLECEIDSIPFLPGRYYVTLLANDRNNSYLPVTNAGFFDVTPANVFNTGQIPSTNHGIIFHKARWSFSN